MSILNCFILILVKIKDMFIEMLVRILLGVLIIIIIFIICICFKTMIVYEMVIL